MNRPKPLLLLILDGWGYREETADNAIALAQLPNWHGLLKDYPSTLVHTEGRFVGLPDGQMGNSEVGHMNIGAGRIVYQDLTRGFLRESRTGQSLRSGQSNRCNFACIWFALARWRAQP